MNSNIPAPPDFNTLAEHIIAMKGDAYLSAHPEWPEIVIHAELSQRPAKPEMKTYDIDVLMHVIKPDGHGSNPLATELHRLACALQEQTDKVHAALDTVRNPEFKGDVAGELVPWPGHFPLELDRSGDFLNDIFVRGTSVSEHLAAGLWEEAEAYIKERFGPEMSESTRNVIARMDAADLRAARNA